MAEYTNESFPKSSQKELSLICENVTKICSERNQLAYPDDAIGYTCVTRMLYSIGRFIGSHPETVLNFHDLLIYTVKNRPDSKGEKAGNIVPDVAIGPRFMRIFEKGYDPKDLEPLQSNRAGDSTMRNFVEERYCEESEKELRKIADDAYSDIYDKNYLDLVDSSVAYTVAVHFIDEVARYLGENKDAVVDLGSCHIFSVSEVDGKFVPLIEIGEKFKLECKNDDETEE